MNPDLEAAWLAWWFEHKPRELPRSERVMADWLNAAFKAGFEAAGDLERDSEAA